MMEINSSIPAAALPVTDTQVPAALKARARANDPKAAKEVARQFEAMFLSMMLKSMRDTVGEDKLFGGGKGEETFRSLLDQQYADAASRSGGVGLAKMIEKELTRTPHPAQAEGQAPVPAAVQVGQTTAQATGQGEDHAD